MKKPFRFDLASGLLAEGLSVIFFGLVVAVANAVHVFFIAFPELGALSSEVLIRPGGKWAKEPWKLIATPSLASALGLAMALYLPYSAATILLCVVLCIGIVLGLRSAVAPAISAGVFPIVMGLKNWLYPVSILASLTALTAILLLWRRTAIGRSLSGFQGRDAAVVEVLESEPDAKWWMPTLLLFVAAVGTAAQISGWHLILFPPLIVMAYEMFGHPKKCPWALQPYTFPAVCTLAACVGVEAVQRLGVTPPASAITLIVTFAMLRVTRLRMPPALAVGLIPLVIQSPDPRYPASVAVGVTSLTLCFLIYRRLSLPLINPSPVRSPRIL